MENKDFYEVIRKSALDADLSSREIPSIDLYIDQILNLVNGKMGETASLHKERPLTKTMINNYSKDGIIKQIKGKKYSKEHIVQMLLVYSMKSTVSMTEIKRFINGLYENEGFDGERLIACYDRYIEEKESYSEKAEKFIAQLVNDEGLNLENEEDFAIALLAIISISAKFKYIAQALIESHYPPAAEPDEEKKAKKESKKEAKVAKKETKKAKKKKNEKK